MDRLPPFQTGLYFAEFEFTAPHLLSSSDCETITVAQLLELAGESPETLLRVPLGYSPSWGTDEALEQLARDRFVRFGLGRASVPTSLAALETVLRAMEPC